MLIGNDIVSLKFDIEDERFLRQRYLDKLFTVSEQKYIWLTNMPAYAIWLLWTAKESAYKIYNKQTGKRMYHPKKFEVKVEDHLLLPYIESVELYVTNIKEREELQVNPSLILFGTVRTPLNDLSVCFFPASNFIHALAAENKAQFNKIRWGVASINSTSNKDQSFYARQLAKNRLAKDMHIPPSTLSIIRHLTGPPGFYFKGNKLNTDLSLTHDANMIAYAFL